MVTLQILNKILDTGDMSLILKNGLTVDYFIGYEDEFTFIVDHYAKYGKVPDKASFLDKFRDFALVEVKEPDKYLLETLYEEYLYYQSVEVVQEVAKLLKTDSRVAVEYLQSQLSRLQAKTVTDGTDIIAEASKRFETYKEKLKGEKPWYIPTGLEELDEILHGWARGEEFVVIFARTGQGKSWFLVKTAAHAWQVGYRVGYISPEMSPDKIGYRFDTVNKHFSNRNLVWGREEEGYEQYIAELSGKPFIVATPQDFQKKITVSKLKHFCQSHKLDILAIDGITYLTDERYKKGDSKTTTLTNISEDLHSLSLELGIPVLVAVQSNRAGVRGKDEDGTPELENIRDSDGIAQNATKVIALRQTGAGLEFGIKKHRDGEMGGRLLYYWNIDKGEFIYIPSEGDSVMPVKRQAEVERIKSSFNDGTEVF